MRMTAPQRVQSVPGQSSNVQHWASELLSLQARYKHLFV